MSRVVPTILFAWDPGEGQTLGGEITFVAAVCTQGCHWCSESICSTPAGSGGHTHPAGMGFWQHSGFFFFVFPLPLTAGRELGGEGLPAVLC